MANMLGITTDEVLKKIESVGAVQESQSNWDQTIMNPLLRHGKKVAVVIEGDVAYFDAQKVDAEESEREWKRYREELAWLGEKVKALWFDCH